MSVEPSQAAPAAANPVDVISSLLDAEKVIPDAPEQETDAQPEGDAHEPAQNAQVEGDDDPEDEGERPAVAEIPLDQLEAVELEVTVKGDDGKDVVEKLPIKALREGYMRQKDYSRKTAALARQHEELGAKTSQAIEGERSAFQNSLQQLQALVIESVAPELKDVNWNNLAANDPAEYVRLRNRAEQITNTLSVLNSRTSEVSVRQKAEQSQALKKTARETWQTLETDIPGFNDGLYQSLMKTGIETGVAPEVVTNWVDPGTIKLLHKAYLYDQLKAGKPADSKKVVTAPTAIKPGSAPTASRQTQRQGKALDNLRKSGSVDALTAFLSESIK